MAAVLGVPTLAYMPFAFFNIFSPFLSVMYGVTGFKVERTAPPAPPPLKPIGAAV
jgi:NhaC family Na+:H+ antiporter